MSDTDNKYKRWVATIQYADNYLPSAIVLNKTLGAIAENYVFQLEVTPSTGKDHYQVCFETTIRKRHSTLLKELVQGLGFTQESGVQLDRMRGSWEESVAYCTKNDSRKEGTTPYYSLGLLEPYRGSDIEFMSQEDKRYPWQRSLFQILYKVVPHDLYTADGRTVIWITDKQGNTGKSVFVKYCCFYNKSVAKVSFGSAGQLRSAIISAGPKKCYFIDMPRTLGQDDSVNNILSAIEDTVNGFLVGNFYGKSATMMFEPPHVVVFSNMECPKEKLSGDRWKIYYILNKELIEYKDEFFYRVDM